MIYYPNTFGGTRIIKGLNLPIQLPRTQRLSRRQNGYLFSPLLNDYDILISKYDKTFFDLPAVKRIVKNDEVGRPDLISFRVYSDTDFWWVILLYNRIADPFEGYTVNQELMIPLWGPLSSWLTLNLIQNPL